MRNSSYPGIFISPNNVRPNKNQRVSNYPVGAKYDVNAPYNEPLTKTEERAVSVSFSFSAFTDIFPGASGEDVKNAIILDIKQYLYSKGFNKLKDFTIDEIDVFDV